MNKLTLRVQEYAESIVRGDVPACETIKLACQRWLDDWQRTDIYFDESSFGKVYRLATNLKHFKGDQAGRFIKLEDWQLFILANIFGWKRADSRTRRYTYADVFVPRKNGKTTLAAIIALYLEMFDDEAGAEVYAAAVDKEQAKICFGTAQELIRNSPFAPMVDVFRGSIVVPSSASVFKPLSKETKNKDGLNPHGAVCDERHAWPTNEIYEVIKTGMGARSQPLIFSISTAGTDTSLPYYRDIITLEDVIRGRKEKDNHFIMLYRPDEGDKWDDPVTWQKVNPNLGVSLSMRYMQEEYEEAKMKGGTTLAAFQTKNLNIWVDAPDVWIADDKVQLCAQPYDLNELAGKRCFVGVDLASKKDITAVAFLFPDQAPMVSRILYFVPESKVAELEDRVDYRRWSEDGWLITTPGDTLDEDWFVDFILKEFDRFDVCNIAYDPWGMWNITQKFGRYQSKLDEYRQDIRNMSVPTKELESMILQKRITFGLDPVIRWMLGNVALYVDPNANVKLNKARSRNKIDGVVALVNAIGGYLSSTAKPSTKELYTDHSLRVIRI